MTSGTRAGLLNELDLHGLVDGHLDSERRSVTLRRLAASPKERALVEAWQGQNDLLRSVFADVEREPIPAMLDLTDRARLQCIPANDAPLVEPPQNNRKSSMPAGRIATAMLTLAIIAAGLGGSWSLLQTSPPTEPASPDTTGAKAVEASALVSNRAVSNISLVSLGANAGVARLPISDIPDVAFAGFRFTGADTEPKPARIIFHYQNGNERLAVSVTQATGGRPSAPSPIADGYLWRTRDAAFAVTGSSKAGVLRGIATALHRQLGR